MPKLSTEPAVIVSLVGAVVNLAIAFGFDLTVEQTTAIAALTLIVAGLVTRQQVTPEAKVDAKVDAAVASVYREVND